MLKAAETHEQIGRSAKLVMERIRQFQSRSRRVWMGTGGGGTAPATGNLR